MGFGLPKLEISFKAAAQAAANRSKQGVVAVIVRDAKVPGLYECRRASELPAELGAENTAYLARAFTGSDLGGPSKVLAVVVPLRAEEGAEDPIAQGLALLSGHSVDYLAGPPDLTKEEGERLVAWVKRVRAEYATVKLVLPNTAADDKAVIDFATDEIQAGQETFTAASYCSRIAGVLAGVPSQCSGTYAVLPEVTGVPDMTRAEQEEAVDAGKLILIHDGTRAKLGRAVNSLTKVPPEGKEDWKKIKVVEAMDLLTYYARTTIENEYIGRCSNSYDNKMLLVTAIDAFHKQLEGTGVLLKGSGTVDIDGEAQEKWLRANGVDTSRMSQQEIREADTGSWVFLAASGRILDAMEDFVLNYTV